MYFRDDYGNKAYEGFDSIREAVEDFLDTINQNRFTGTLDFYKGIDSDGDYCYFVGEGTGSGYLDVEDADLDKITNSLENGYWDDDWTELEDVKRFEEAYFTSDENNGIQLYTDNNCDIYEELSKDAAYCEEEGYELVRHDHDFSFADGEHPNEYHCGFCSYVDVVKLYKKHMSVTVC